MTAATRQAGPLFAFEGHIPEVAPDAWVAPTACVIGRVSLGARVSVLFNAVLRADNNTIAVGPESNVQDGGILHCDPPEIAGRPVEIGARVSIGHGARLHGCRVGDGSLVGIGAIVLDGATIGTDCLVAAGALVPPGMTVPDGSLVVGAPAQVKRALRDGDREILRLAADGYLDLGPRHRAGLAPASAALDAALDGASDADGPPPRHSTGG